MAETLHVLQAHAVLLALVLPVAIRLVGHWLPEEPLMVAMGVLAAHSTPARAALLLGTLWLSHAVTDYAVFSLGRVAAPHLDRWPRFAGKVRPVAERVAGSRWLPAALIPARILPLGRGAWLIGFGVAGVPRLKFAALDAAAVAAFLLVWCGLGWVVGERAYLFLSFARSPLWWAVVGVVAIATCAIVFRCLKRRANPGSPR